MLNPANDFIAQAPLVAAPPRQPLAEEPRDPVHSPFTLLRRKVSSRLARHIAIKSRRLANARPMVSFTFDDAASSARTIGAPMLEQRGGRGTYYVTSGLIGRETENYPLIDRDGVRDLHLRGHEIGLHTHKHHAVGWLSAREFRDDLERSRETLEDIHEGIRPRNFAYPYGLAAFERKRQLGELVDSSRGVAPGVNAGRFDPHFLRCVELADRKLTPERLAFYLDAAMQQGGWLIFLSHDIAARPSRHGCTVALFQFALDGVAARGLEMVTVAEALSRSQPIGWSLARSGR